MLNKPICYSCIIWTSVKIVSRKDIKILITETISRFEFFKRFDTAVNITKYINLFVSVCHIKQTADRIKHLYTLVSRDNLEFACYFFTICKAGIHLPDCFFWNPLVSISIPVILQALFKWNIGEINNKCTISVFLY